MESQIGLWIAVLAAPPVIGAFIDRWMTKHQKSTLHSLLAKWLERLENTSIPNLPRGIAQWGLDFCGRYLRFGSRFQDVFPRLLLLSILLTTVAWIIGRIIDEASGGTLFISNLHWSLYLASLPISIALNAPFDVVTTYVTMHILKEVESRPTWQAIPLMLLDIALAYALTIAAATLALLCLSVASGATADLVVWVKTAHFDFICPGVGYQGNYLTWTGRLFAATALVPTTIILVLVMAGAVIKFSLIICRQIGVFFLGRATDDEPFKLIVFTLAGSLFTPVLLIFKILKEIAF